MGVVVGLVAMAALAADPGSVADNAAAPPTPTEGDGAAPAAPEIDPAVVQLTEERDRALAAAQAQAAAAAANDATWTLIATLLDDRLPAEARIAAAATLGEEGGSRALAGLRAAAGDRDAEVQRAAALAALGGRDPAGAEVVRRVLLDDEASRVVRIELARALGERGTTAAAHVLYDVSAAPGVPAGVRSAAVHELADRFPALLGRWGGAPAVVDPLGGLLFVTANGLAGGILLSSVGVGGEFDGAEAFGAVGGASIGLGAGAVVAATRPLTFGQGVAYASGVGFGLTYGLWTTTAIHGGWRHLNAAQRSQAAGPAAVYRALGVVGGVTAGTFALAGHPATWDVIEVDTAGYLGSAIALGATALATYRPPSSLVSTTPRSFDTSTFGTSTFGTRPPEAATGVTTGVSYERGASQRHAAAELAGATVGLGVGVALRRTWELQPRDAALGLVIGGQAAWIGGWTPVVVGVDPRSLKGQIRLPWNAGIAGGLALAELTDAPYGRAISTAWGSVAMDALGAGLPMLVGYDDPRSVASWMLPLGALGTAAAFVAHPTVAPSASDWVMVAVGTSVALNDGLAIGGALGAADVWVDSGQANGLGLVVSGVAAGGLYALSAVVEPRPDDVLAVGSGAAWGAGYGALGAYVLSSPDAPATGVLVSEAIGATAGGAAVMGALQPTIGLQPKQTVIPQLAGLTGGTVAALGVGLGSSDGRDVALGALVGGTLGLGIGTAVEVARATGPNRAPHPRGLRAPRVGGVWTPLVEPHVGPDGAVTPVAGVRALGW